MVYLTCLDREAGEYKDCQGCMRTSEARIVHYPPQAMTVNIRAIMYGALT